MGTDTYTKTQCDVKGCPVKVEVQGNPDLMPLAGWCQVSVADYHKEIGWDNPAGSIICPEHAAAVQAVLSGKGKVSRVRGVDKKPRAGKKKTAQEGAQQGQQTASVLPVVESTTPAIKKTRKVKGDPLGNTARESNETTAKEAAKMRATQHLECPGCPAHLKEACPLEGTAALTCWETRNKKSAEVTHGGIT